jgi:hypothetical protein
MKSLIQMSLILWFVSSTAAQAQPAQPEQKVLRVYDWTEVKLQPQPSGSEVFSTNGVSVLKIENTNDAPLNITLLTITNASLIAKANSVSLEMKFEDVLPRPVVVLPSSGSRGRWFPRGTNYQPSSLIYSVRILPEAAGGDETTNSQWYDLGGSSNWKHYGFGTSVAPWQRKPESLEVILSLGKGTVYLRPIKILRWVSNSGTWWTPQQAGLIGGIGGSLIGCLGGLIGLLVSKGKARNFVLAAVKCFIVLGILLTIGGLVAVVSKQPYAVWYALLLPGVILILVFSLNLHSIQRRYDELEIRRMTSIDATGS